MASANDPDIEMLPLPNRRAADGTIHFARENGYANKNSESSPDVAVQDLENGISVASAFTNDNVHSVAWRNLTVRAVDHVGRQTGNILDNVSGIVFRGQIMAIMGPSGSGKTTLLNALAQRGMPVVEGKVYINGAEHSLETHRTIGSYVEQEDTLIGALNVEETLQFAARLALSRSMTKQDLEIRVRSLLEAFGLQNQTRTLIGTPLQKGLSGGQKRRVSVATQLITAPRVVYLDEPTSGLDSTASYEIMSYIKNIGRQHNLIIIASIHQPSTKTFDLFDQMILLSGGRTCYLGPVDGLPPFLERHGMPVPVLTNPAEHALDIVNVDFTPRNAIEDGHVPLERLINEWNKSSGLKKLDLAIRKSIHEDSSKELSMDRNHRPPPTFQALTLIHRAWIKSYRDIVTYWIRVVMYLGLAVMMGTVWLRLGTDQRYIQPFINAIFFGSAFMSFMAVAYVPAFLEDRAIFVKERANGLYGPTAFLLSNLIIGLPYLFLISVLFSAVAYWLSNFNPTAESFFTWILWLFLDLVAAESLVVLLSSLFPNFVVALALIAFANGLWMSVGGFLVSLPVLNVFWKYVFHYIDYQAYVFQGMMVNEFRARSYDCDVVVGSNACHCMYQSDLENECKIAGTAILSQYGYSVGRQSEWIGIMVGIIVVYRSLGWLVTWLRHS